MNAHMAGSIALAFISGLCIGAAIIMAVVNSEEGDSIHRESIFIAICGILVGIAMIFFTLEAQ